MPLSGLVLSTLAPHLLVLHVADDVSELHHDGPSRVELVLTSLGSQQVRVRRLLLVAVTVVRWYSPGEIGATGSDTEST